MPPDHQRHSFRHPQGQTIYNWRNQPICAQLPIAPSTYYDAKSRPASLRARRHVAMTAMLVGLWEANYRVYGARKLWKAAQHWSSNRHQATGSRLLAGLRQRIVK